MDNSCLILDNASLAGPFLSAEKRHFGSNQNHFVPRRVLLMGAGRAQDGSFINNTLGLRRGALPVANQYRVRECHNKPTSLAMVLLFSRRMKNIPIKRATKGTMVQNLVVVIGAGFRCMAYR